jgi:hypothetical protein
VRVVCSRRRVSRQVLSFGAASLVALSTAGAAFAEGSTLPTLVDDTKLNAGVQLIYEARRSRVRSRRRCAPLLPAQLADAAVCACRPATWTSTPSRAATRRLALRSRS